MSDKTRKVAVIGVGHVGAHVAYSLAVQGICDELMLVDKNADKLKAEVQDLRDAVAYMPHNVRVTAADYGDLADVDVIVNAIGDITLLWHTTERTLEMNFTVAQVKGYVKKVIDGGFRGVWINISNPCDIVTGVIAELSGLPKGRVFGTGTCLDTSRLLAQLALQTGIDHQSISAYMIGEHGHAQLAAWSCVTFGGVPLAKLAAKEARFAFDRDELQHKAIMGGWVTMVGKKCTEYGICTTAARMVRVVLGDEQRIMPASTELCGEYGEHGVYVGVPCLIGKNGIERVLELPLSAEEKEKFHSCCDHVRANIQAAQQIAAAE